MNAETHIITDYCVLLSSMSRKRKNPCISTGGQKSFLGQSQGSFRTTYSVTQRPLWEAAVQLEVTITATLIPPRGQCVGSSPS